MTESCSPSLLEKTLARPALEITPVAPVSLEKRGDVHFVDFGKAAWGNLQLRFSEVPTTDLVVRLGEKLAADGSIDRQPPGSVNFREIVLTPQPGQTLYQLEIPPHWMHADPMAVATPPKIGEVTVFRYAEIEGAQETLELSQLRQLFVHAAFDDDAAHFECSDSTLNAIWDLCKHTIKATTAFGVYIDGERERIPYEADAYINQLSHLAFDFNPDVARASIEHLLVNPTWPTEWSFHTIMMVAADYRATGDSSFAARHYEELKKKLLMDKAREDGLLRAGGIIDWPPSERDGYNHGEAVEGDPHTQVGPEINTVVNAFYFHALKCMAFLASALDQPGDAEYFSAKAQQVCVSFNNRFFDTEHNIYIDGISDTGSTPRHVSLHANMFALAFGLVPPDRQGAVADYVEARGMACSVYAAQYLLEALFRAGRDKAALQLLTARGERSWWHMIESGSTMTWEAWNETVKSNLTWNHAWGTSPANIITRYILGVQAQSPGYETILIAPQPGTLRHARGSVPTPYGAVEVAFKNDEVFELEITIPAGTTAQVQWPSGHSVPRLTTGHHQLVQP